MPTEHIYYDMQYASVSGDQESHLVFEDNRPQDIITKANDYKLSIVRFQVDTNYLPSYICFIQPDQPNVNLSIYSVNLSIDGIESGQKFMIWEPVNKKGSGQVFSNSIQRIDNEYYWGYNCQYFLDLLNKQLVEAYDEILTSNPSLSGCNVPFFRQEDNKTVLYTDTGFDCKVYFNKALYSKFSSFNLYNQFLGNGKYYEIIVDKFNTITIGSDIYHKTIQEYDTISNWTPVSSLLFTSRNIPMISGLSGPAINNVNGYNVKVDGSDFNNVITDIQTNDNFYKSNLIYSPAAEYRWITLRGSSGVRDISISCYWKDKFGGIHPLKMPAGCSASIKLLFQKN